jgi:hypothetical protein
VPADIELCTKPCSPTEPCLYDVASDPQERINLAQQMPAKVTEMMTRLASYASKVRLPERIPDSGSYCKVMKGRGGGPGGTMGWNGPWMGM